MEGYIEKEIERLLKEYNCKTLGEVRQKFEELLKQLNQKM